MCNQLKQLWRILLVVSVLAALALVITYSQWRKTMICDKCGNQKGMVHHIVCAAKSRHFFFYLIVILVLGSALVFGFTRIAKADHGNQAITCYKFDDVKSIIDAEADMESEESLAFREKLMDGETCGLVNLQMSENPNIIYSRKINEKMMLGAVTVTMPSGAKAYAIIMAVAITIEQEEKGEAI